MKPIHQALAAALLLTACGGNPFTTTPDAGGGDPGGIDGERTLPPGTTSPTRNKSIVRREARTANGNGYVSTVSYNADDDTFTVDGLAFDGGNVYQRGSLVSSLGPFAVYEADSTYADDVTGVSIPQFGHRALYGVSDNGNTQFAVVRTGAYIPYGFGGFVYQRNGRVDLPTSGQAHYEGSYAALRDFSGRPGLEYATGDMTVEIDFNDFNAGDAVKGYVSNRAIYDIDGNDITNDVLDALSQGLTTPLTELPVLTFKVGPGVMDANGEITGTLGSYYFDGGPAQTYEQGKYYAIVANSGIGDSATAAGEIVGVIVVEGTDPRDDVQFRETGGFILYR